MLENKPGKKAEHKRVCRVAYTLNNEQPVISTIIGDQPLFYMDYECDYEDEYILDVDGYDSFEKEIAILKKEISALEKFSGEFVYTPEERFARFGENCDSLTSSSKRAENYADLEAIIAQSRLGEDYLSFAKANGVEIIKTRQVEQSEYHAKTSTILINEALGYEDQILLLVGELRRHWMDQKGALVNPLLFNPDDAVFVNRLQAADVCVSMIRIGWELQLAGERGVWERIENSSLADLAQSFAREAYFDFRTLTSGAACAAVFENWFLSERCRAADKNVIQNMLSDHQGYVFDVEGGENKKSLTPEFVAHFGTMPSGKNYLSGNIDTVINDPIFTDVRDRANANFLWFIKFERSFREAEQELQIDSGSKTDGVRSSVPQDKNQDQSHDAFSADVISLSERTSSKPSASVRSNEALQQSAKIIYLRRWSGD